jgi:uncharacterized flavoprotein (TIGR03862 family)
MSNETTKTIAIIGGGPAGLIAAEKLSADGFAVTLYERKPSVGRKFLMAGRGGLNLTHSEDLDQFVTRYREREGDLAPLVRDFTPQHLRIWCEGLGQETFVGTSGRVFPKAFKASPLMRAWIKRLEAQGVTFLLQHYWRGWGDDGALLFDTPDGALNVTPDATLLALGGGSWAKFGSDGAWCDMLAARGVEVAPLQAANCGFCANWSEIFRKRFAGEPLKSVVTSIGDEQSSAEIMITQSGVEGGGIYALSAPIREAINREGKAVISVDLKPDLALADIEERLAKPRGRQSFSNYVRKTLNLSPLMVNLLMESGGVDVVSAENAAALAARVKACSLILTAPFPIDRAISSAGGVTFGALDEHYMLRNLPGVFVAGEMLDWEAPTGGYLLQACFATGIHAAAGIAHYLKD